MRKYLLLGTVFAALLLLAACPTTEPGPTDPRPVDPTGPTTPADTTPAPAELKAQAMELKAKVIKYAINELLPDDYGIANGFLIEGESTYGTKNAESKAAYEKAIAALTALLEKGLPLAAERDKSRAEEVRAAAVKELADSLWAGQFAKAEAAYALGIEKQGGKAWEAAIEAFGKARVLFGVLYKKSLAEGLRGEIDDNGYAEYDRGNFDTAEGKFATIDGLYETDPGKALDAADEAILRYNLVVQKAQELGAGSKKEACEKARDYALSVGADSLAAEEFGAAEGKYGEAGNKAGAKDWAAAGKLYDAARLAFVAAAEKAQGGVSARTEAAEARRTAEEAKAQALAVKADVASKAEFDAALKVYEDADGAYNKGDYEAAKDGFAAAEAKFGEAYAIAKAKRDKAQAILDDLARRKAESLEKAAAGDATIGGAK